jgi:alpha-N-arabinofuranosidase
MLAVASWLNVFIRQAKHIGMATIAQSVNVISPLMTTERGVVKQTTYWPLMLFSKFMRGRSLAAHVRSMAYTGRTWPEWLASTMDLPLLDVSAALSDGGFVNLAVVNLSPTEAVETALPVIKGPVNVFVVGGNINQLRDNNIEGKEKVYIRESKWQGGEKFGFEKHSFTLLRWKADGLDLPAEPTLNIAHDEPNQLHHDEPNGWPDELLNGAPLERSTMVSEKWELNGMANGH